MKNSKRNLIIVSISIILLTICIYINFINIIEAYGSGPPYYGRTTNMDKWNNPIPSLLLLDLSYVGLQILLVYWARKPR